MAGGKRSIRGKIIAILLVPVVSLVVVWAFAATVTIQSALELLRISTIYDNVVVPSRTVVTELQHERLMSAVFLGSASSFHTNLDAQRQRTDAAADDLARMSKAAAADTPPAMWDRLQELLRQLHRLDALRDQVDGRDLSRLNGIEEYSSIVETGYQVYDRIMISPDLDLVQQTKAIILVGRSREVVSQESALISGALEAGRMTKGEHQAFSEMVGKRRLLYQLGTSQLDPELLKPYQGLDNSPAYTSFVTMENQVVGDLTQDVPLPPAATPWRSTAEALSGTFDDLGGETSRKISERAAPLARNILLRVGAVGGLGLLGVALTVFISFRFARRLTVELVELESAARDLADNKLPGIVTRLKLGEDVDVQAESPPIATGETLEVANVGRAFDSVRRTAIEAAVGQAEMRKSINKVFVNLARRSQSLLHRQLSMLDGLERQVTDPELLEELFGVDHLTTRMRRHSEGLIILSGSAPGRGWRNPVPLYDVVRAAVEEVEDYLRVTIAVPYDHALVGGAVTDTIHMIAELVENATIFSPPQAQVLIRGEAVARGFALEIEDRGLGISLEVMAQINAQLADPPEFNLADSDRLGLFVVGQLAKRHGIKVSLRTSPYGGTSAIALIPRDLVVPADSNEVERLATPEPEPEPRPRPIPALVVMDAEDDDDVDAAGLPRRVRQASLAPQLREERPGNVYTSFKAGWRRAQDEESS
ncbi:nitrate- and nitrite sensing domain-containing protein [Streptosporangiaceae bacterium NEAU-GS5]|nr:nitrate- and nitrite sensing domain-containing protein [Streptosporangiaceae bacterium NEAU-GS5]